MKSIVFTSLGIVIIGAAATIGYQQYNKSLNANTNSNVSVQPANTNTAGSNTVKPIKNNLIGTWIGTSTDSKTKLVITEDEYTEYNDGKETGRAEYKLLDEQTLELKIGKDLVNAKAIVEGDELTITSNSKTNKFRRESGNPADTSANAFTVEDIRKKIIGTWKYSELTKKKEIKEDGPVFTEVEEHRENIIFSENNQFYREEVKSSLPITRSVYEIADAKTIKILNYDFPTVWNENVFNHDNFKVEFEDDNTITLSSDTALFGKTVRKLKRQSNNSKIPTNYNIQFFGYLRFQFAGHWIGINGTNSEGEKIISYAAAMGQLINGKYRGPFNIDCDDSVSTTDCNLKLRDGVDDNPNRRIIVDGDVLTIQDNGVTKKYNRQTTID